MKTNRSILLFRNIIFIILSFVFVAILNSCEKKACRYCDGTGKIYIENIPNEKVVYTTCPHCGGSGYTF